MVGHSAGVFDEEKLAWVNRHYLKIADRTRLAESVGAVLSERWRGDDAGRQGLAFLASVVPIASGSVDRLDQVPGRLAFLFDYGAGWRWRSRRCKGDAFRRRTRGRAGAGGGLAPAARLDRDRFRETANEVRGQTGQKAKALFHPDSSR